MSKHVAVLMGGWSAEREISLRSGKACAAALDRLGYRTTAIDVGPFVERKRVALATHASQMDESFWARVPTAAFGALFGEESFIRAHDTTSAPLPETDLFVGFPT